MKHLRMIALLLAASLTGCAAQTEESAAGVSAGSIGAARPQGQMERQDPVQEAQTEDEDGEKAAAELVENFGRKLQLVSLLAPRETVAESMQEHYGDYVSPELLEKWQSDPEQALGRTVSSPWPDRIEVREVRELSDGTYQVEGDVIEVTSVEKENGGIAGKQPVIFKVKKIGDEWRIVDAASADGAESGVVTYENEQYGFRFVLPESWEGYTIVTEQWEGQPLEGAEQGASESGPVVKIRHPQWTPEAPRQDIPIMVFTLDQWSRVQEEKLAVGAAPVPPQELGRNDAYVFALPARYNYAFPEGYEEVEEILKNDPLRTF